MFNIGADVSEKMVNFKFTNSIINAGTSPFTTTGGGTTNCAHDPTPNVLLPKCFAPYQFSNNVIIAPPSNTPPSDWPSSNFFADSATDIQFVNYQGGNGGDYHLRSTSPYKNAGTDGRDLGADVETIQFALTNVHQ
jgi:hypothetical protein